jgi:transcriptional regulator with XRE-family HTH domain
VPDDRVLGAEMRKRRERAGLSLRNMAKRCGWSPPYVSDLELGRRRWGPKQVKRYTEALA